MRICVGGSFQIVSTAWIAVLRCEESGCVETTVRWFGAANWKMRGATAVG